VSVAEALRSAVPALAASGIETSRLDAELLVAAVLGVTRTWLVAHPEAALCAVQVGRLADMVARRAAREPLPYLLGQWEFMGMRLRVTPAVLIPRPETEILVEAVAERLLTGARVLDVGTGSGCIALGLGRLRPDVSVIGIDCSEAAVAIARENARENAMAGRICFCAATFPDPDADWGGPFDAVVANPPYIPEAMVAELEPEVRDHEPRGALAGGADGLSLHAPLLQYVGGLLRCGGVLAVEVMAGQAGVVQELARRVGGWEEPDVVPDLSGIPRVLLWRREVRSL
jgi:release factor glutamine methyltransferase